MRPQSRRLIRQVSADILAQWKASHALDGANVKTNHSADSSEDDQKAVINKDAAQLGLVDRSFVGSMMKGRIKQPISTNEAQGREAAATEIEPASAKEGDRKMGKHGPMNDVEVSKRL